MIQKPRNLTYFIWSPPLNSNLVLHLGTLSTFARKSKLKIIDLEAILQNDRLPSPSSSQSEPKKEKPNKGEDHVQTAACVIEAYNKRDQSSNAGKSLPWNSDVINELASDLKDIIDFNSKRSLSGSLETLTDFMAGEEEMKLDVEAELPSDQVSKVDDSQGESLVDTPGESTIEDESPIRNDVFSLQDTDAYQNGHVDLKISTDSQDQKEEIFNISESQSSDGLPDSSNIKDLRNNENTEVFEENKAEDIIQDSPAMSEASCDASEADLDMKFEPVDSSGQSLLNTSNESQKEVKNVEAIKREIFENIHKEAAKVIASEVPDRVIPKDIVHSIVGVINSQNKTALHPKNNKPTRSTVKKANKIGELIYKYVEKFDNLNDPTKCTKQITIRMVRENETDQSQ